MVEKWKQDIKDFYASGDVTEAKTNAKTKILCDISENGYPESDLSNLYNIRKTTAQSWEEYSHDSSCSPQIPKHSYSMLFGIASNKIGIIGQKKGFDSINIYYLKKGSPEPREIRNYLRELGHLI